MRKRKNLDKDEVTLYDKVTKLQAVIIDNISKLKKNKYYICQHLLEIPDDLQIYNPKLNYYEKFWKLILMNQIKITKIQKTKDYITDYRTNLDTIESLLKKRQLVLGTRLKKNIRRSAQEILKKQNCPYPKCFKSYGSEISLNLHIKLKHNGGNKTDREKAAEIMIQANQKCMPLPQFRISLPPDFIDTYMVSRDKKDSNILNNIQGNYNEKLLEEKLSSEFNNKKDDADFFKFLEEAYQEQ